MPVATVHHIGRTHRLWHQNCQDAAFATQPSPDIAIGVVADGCGSHFHTLDGKHRSRNEVGAQLFGSWVCNWLAAHVTPTTTAETITPRLNTALCGVLRNHLDTFALSTQRRQYLATHLLFTLVGFVQTPNHSWVFYAGDGYYGYDNNCEALTAADNRPSYVAYQLLDAAAPGLQMAVVDRPVSRLWCATDGWDADSLNQFPWQARPLHQQRWLNQRAQQKPYFDDDAALVFWEQ